MFDRSDYFIRKKVYHGQDLVPRPRRLALKNLFLHGVEPHIYQGNTVGDPDRDERYDVILTNPLPAARCSARKARGKPG